MPSSSPKQARFMKAVAGGMKPRGGGPSQSVAREFVEADKVKKKIGYKGNPEYRHDDVKKSRNPQTRGNPLSYTPGKVKSPILEKAGDPGGPQTPGAKAKRKAKQKAKAALMRSGY